MRTRSDSMPDETVQECIDLRLEGCSYREIAEVVDRHPSTVREVLYRHGLKGDNLDPEHVRYFHKPTHPLKFTEEQRARANGHTSKK